MRYQKKKCVKMKNNQNKWENNLLNLHGLLIKLNNKEKEE
jgi:hypothetical protein